MTDENMLFATEDQMAELLEEAPAETLTDTYLVFLTDGLRFGVEAEYVVEIINNYAITRLPIVPPYVRGIINLRGLIIPILDIRSRLGKAPAEDDCIVVLSQNETQLGILVDTVDRMVDVDRESISPMPAQNTQELISGMCSLAEGETLLILDCEKLFQA